MIGVLLPIFLSWADSMYVGGLKRYQTMGKLVLAMEMGGVLIICFLLSEWSLLWVSWFRYDIFLIGEEFSQNW